MTIMVKKHTANIFPPRMFLAVVAALTLTLLAIASVRLAGFQPATNLPSEAPLQSRVLKFEDHEKGRVVVRDASDGALIAEFGTGEGAFIRATVRALVNDRKRNSITRSGNFRLAAYSQQQLFLIDEASGRVIALNAFGPTNTAAFAGLMQ